VREVRIPQERVGNLIGEDGENLERIEDRTETGLDVEDDNLARVEGSGLGAMDAQRIVKAVGRGFGIDEAIKLARQDYTLHVMDVGDYASTQNSVERLKGRVIGRDGDAKRHIEKEADVEMSVYGSTVSVIGEARKIEVVIQVVESLLNGSSHSTAYKVFDRNRELLLK
jgi:arCOG04150 universal archaeal KH domain protein